MKIQLPNNNWQPRGHQLKSWTYLENGGKRASLWWHRRAGKDEVCLQWTAIASQLRVGNYWHMLPESEQARRAIWAAVNPKTGLRRIDEVFPLSMREKTLDQEMFIRFKSGSTWQVIGSNSFMNLVGAAPIGIVFSEWSKSHPQAWAYLSPILLENNGWALFPTTPMGKNHAFRTHESFEKDPDAFAETLPATATEVYTPEQLSAEKANLIDVYGHTLGEALYAQEYECSSEAAILGAVYAREITELRNAGRVTLVEPVAAPVYTAWDLGRTDSTAIWWFQIVAGELRILEHYENQLQDIDHYCEMVKGREITNDLAEWAYTRQPVRWGGEVETAGHRQKYDYGVHFLPHDAAHKRLGSQGVSLEQMVRKALGAVQIVNSQSLPMTSQFAMARAALRRAWFAPAALDGLETLSQFRYGYDENKRKLSEHTIHDWTSHTADAWRYLSIAAENLLASGIVPPVTQAIRPRRKKSIWTA